MIRLLLVLALVLAAPAGAQIVNVQSMLATEAPEGLSGSVTGGADWRTGNTNLLSLAAGPLARYRSGDHLVIATWCGEVKMIKATPDDGEYTDIVKNSFVDARYRYTLTGRLLAEAFAQHEFDEFRRLKLRFVAGTGPKYDLVKSEDFLLSAATAYMIEIEDLNSGYSDRDGDDLRHRASNYVMVRYKLDDRVDVADTFYIQPRLNEPADFRLLNDAELVVNLTKKVSLTTTFSVAYDNHPPDGPTPVEDLDTALKTSVTIGF